MTDMIKRLLSWSGTPFDDDAHEAADRIEALTAKLTKAVEATEMMLHRYLLYCGGDAMPFGGHTDQKIVESVRATLAEVKGESHE